MSLLAMTHAGYVAGGWIATFGVFGAYALATLRRGRKLSEVVPSDERRWS